MAHDAPFTDVPENSSNGSAAHAHDHESTPEVLAEFSRELSTLFRQELQLAKAELAGKARHGAIGGSAVGTGALLGSIGLATLVAAAVAAVSLVWPVWAAALVVAAGVFLVAGLAATIGVTQFARMQSALPEQAIKSTKEDIAWLKTQARLAKR